MWRVQEAAAIYLPSTFLPRAPGVGRYGTISGTTDLACDFDGTGSSDSDGSIWSHEWDFGDGAVGSGATASHAYASGGTYTVTLTVTDDEGASASESGQVSVSAGDEPGGSTTMS